MEENSRKSSLGGFLLDMYLMICWEKYSKINKKFDYLMELYSDLTLEEMRNERKNMKPKQDDKFFDEYTQKRKNGCFYSELGSESLLITKIWDFNKTILDKWADVNLLISINEIKTNRKMKKGLKSIANNLREIADKLDKAVEEKNVDIINEE